MKRQSDCEKHDIGKWKRVVLLLLKEIAVGKYRIISISLDSTKNSKMCILGFITQICDACRNKNVHEICAFCSGDHSEKCACALSSDSFTKR